MVRSKIIFFIAGKVQKKSRRKARIPTIFFSGYRLCSGSSDTVNFFLPFLRRAANTRRPFFVAIRLRKPCLFLRFLCEGWNVLFIVCYFSPKNGVQIYVFFLDIKLFSKKNQIIQEYPKVLYFCTINHHERSPKFHQSCQ
jgi:hypothetical protein